MSDLTAAARPYLHARIVGLAAGTIGAILVARIIGPEARGTLALLIFVAVAGATLFGIGTPLGSYDAVRRGASAQRVLRIVVLVGLACSVFTGAVWVLLANVDLAGLGGDVLGEGGLAVPLAVAAGALVIAQASAMILVATGRNGVAALVQSSQPIGVLVLYVGAVFTVGLTHGTAVVAYAASWTCVAVAGCVAAGRASRREDASPRSDEPVGAIVGRGFRALPGDILNLLSYRLDVVVVGHLAGAASLGTYAVGVQLLEPLWLAASAVAMGVMGISGQAAGRDVAATVSAARATALMCLGAAALATMGVWLFGVVLLGDGYETLPIVMAGLVPGVAALAISKVFAATVIARGALGMSSVVAGATVLVNTALNVLLVPIYAELGAAIASSVAYTLSAVMWVTVLQRRDRSLGWVDLVPTQSDWRLIRSLVQRGPRTSLS